MFPVTGLVFCGGGGRGAYQIGVWQALTAGRVINSVLKFLGSDDRTITIDPDRLSRGGIFSLEGLVNVIAENGVNDCVSG